MIVLVTGGAGFIGSAVTRKLVHDCGATIVNVDKLTYAGNIESLAGIMDDPCHRFEQVDICDAASLRRIFNQYQPEAVVHLAAESHVDRSIDGPGEFVQTNVVGTFVLLQEARRYWDHLSAERRDAFRFLHVSTDEVFGSLGTDGFFTEQTPYDPSSPYSATKAASDHIVRAWYKTYGLPCLITNCSNNYGPFQFPEKLIPLMILNALEGNTLPVYGRGANVRDWLFVDDHADAIITVLQRGSVGETYAVSGGNERRNLDVVESVCDIVDELAPERLTDNRRALIRFVTDRPGHDLRYAIDATKLRRELGWEPRETFESGLEKTVRWYLDNRTWWERVRSGVYRGERLGLAENGKST